MKRKAITVLTPTYNRVRLLDNLYRSLAVQTDRDFVWLIIDDGSTDSTKEKVGSYIRENLVEIRYIYQENRGKYAAHNTGVRECDTELMVCVDSDDELYPQAIEKTLKFWSSVKDDDRIAGIVSPCDIGGQAYFNNPPAVSPLMDLYNSGRLAGDTMLVYRADVLRQYLFPEVPGENFMSECVIYYQIDKKYVLATQNEYLYKAEYQNDGLTRNIEKIHWKNPGTTLIMYCAVAAFDNSFVKAAKAYGCYLAWKYIHRLPGCDLYRVRLPIKSAGFFLKRHYVRLFRKQREALK